MALEVIHRCTRCGLETERKLLMVKKSVFMTLGRTPKTIRSRTTDWLCPSCVAADSDWQAKPYHESPGLSENMRVR